MAGKLGISSDRIAVGAGLVGLIDVAVKALSEPDQNIVTAEITFEGYKLMAKANRRECRMAKLTNNAIDLERLRELCDENTGIVFIANPNNPTGTMISHEALHEFLSSVNEKTCVIVDEAYREYVTGSGYADTLELQQLFPNLITFRTFSKIYGLAGLRIGYVIAQPPVIQAFTSCRIPFAVNSLAAAAAFAALDDTEFVNSCREKNAQERNRLCAALKALGYQVTPPTANFIYVELASRSEKLRIMTLLKNEGILVRDLDNFGVDSALRITVGRLEENQKLVKTIGKIKRPVR